MAAAGASAHVPAWKRLGLKLKNSFDNKDSIAPTAPGDNAQATTSTTKGEPVHAAKHAIPPPSPASGEFGLSKKRKRPSGRSEVTTHVTTSPSSHKASDTGKPSTSVDKPAVEHSTPVQDKARRKKSVTFTNDTKTTDGDTSLAIPATPPPGKTVSGLASDLSSSPSVPVENTKDSESHPKLSKAEKKRQRRHHASTEPQSTPEYLTYLTRYHSSRSTWKFNKSHQTSLLKNMWNIYRVPADYDGPLESYIQGLMGANARKLLREKAHDVLAADSALTKKCTAEAHAGDEIDALAADRERASAAALEKWIAVHERTTSEAKAKEIRAEARKERELAGRAEMVLRALGADPEVKPETVTNGIAAGQANDGNEGSKPKRKRKSRAVESESESSSDSSDSDSDDGEVRSKAKVKIAKANGTPSITLKPIKSALARSNVPASDSSEDSASDSSDSDSSSSASPSSASDSSGSGSSDSDSDSDSDRSSSDDSDSDAPRVRKRAKTSTATSDKQAKAREASKTFDKAFLDSVFPKQDLSHIKARAAEERAAKAARAAAARN